MLTREASGLRKSPSTQDRMFLVLDAMERAKEAGVRIRWNSFMRRVVYARHYIGNIRVLIGSGARRASAILNHAKICQPQKL